MCVIQEHYPPPRPPYPPRWGLWVIPTLTLSLPPQPGHSVGMLAAVEHGPILCSDSNILCLSWKGRVPKSEKDKPVCRRRYYEEGWLATGNGRGVVGVTFTSSHCRRDRNTPQRINFNLRGHNSEVGAPHKHAQTHRQSLLS